MHRLSLGTLVAALMATLPLPALADEPAGTFTLEEVLERAGDSALVRIADAELNVATTREREARALRLPDFRARLTVSPAPEVRLDDPNDPFSNQDSDAELLSSIFGGGASLRGELRTTIPLSTFGKVRLARQLASAGVDAAAIEREASVRESQFEAYRAYLGVQVHVVLEDLLAEADNRLARATELLEVALDDGDRSARTSLRQLTIANASLVEQRAAADRSGRVARAGLVEALALPHDFEVTAFDTTAPEAQAPELSELIDFALEQRTDLRMLRVANEAAALETELRWRQLTPDLFFSARLNGAFSPSVDDVSGPFVYDNFNRFGFGFAVGLNWDMNPFVVSTRARRAAAQSSLVDAQQSAAETAVVLDVVDAYEEARSTLDIARAYDEALRASRAWLQQRWFQFDQGLADYDDIKDPLQAYYATAAAYHVALVDHRLAVANLALKTGHRDLTSWPAPGAE